MVLRMAFRYGNLTHGHAGIGRDPLCAGSGQMQA